jgi:hypothetical protein
LQKKNSDERPKQVHRKMPLKVFWKKPVKIDSEMPKRTFCRMPVRTFRSGLKNSARVFRKVAQGEIDRICL